MTARSVRYRLRLESPTTPAQDSLSADSNDRISTGPELLAVGQTNAAVGPCHQIGRHRSITTTSILTPRLILTRSTVDLLEEAPSPSRFSDIGRDIPPDDQPS